MCRSSLTQVRTLLRAAGQGGEKVVDGGGEDELEAAAPIRPASGHPSGGSPPSGRAPARRVHLLHEEDDAAGADLASPRRDRADQRLRRPFSARPRVDPHRDELHLARVVAAERADDAGPALLVLRDEERLVGTVGGLGGPVAPDRLGLADGVFVARREDTPPPPGAGAAGCPASAADSSARIRLVSMRARLDD